MARLFDGINDSLEATVDLSSTAIVTVTMRLYWDAYASDGDLALEFTPDLGAGFNGFGVQPNATGVFVCGMGGPAGGTFWTDSFTRPSAAAWHLYTFVFDRTAKVNKAWVDGVSQSLSVDSHTATLSNNFDNSTLNVMSRNNASLFGAGRMAEVAIWSGELSAGDLALLHAGSLPGSVNRSNLLFYCPVCGLASPELSVVGSNATVNGAVFAASPVPSPDCFRATSQYAVAVIADSPIAWWRLGSGGNDVEDSSGNGHQFTKTGTLTETPGLLPTDPSPSRDFPGDQNNYYEAADHADFDMVNTASYSIEAWVNLDTVDTGFRRILDHDDNTNGWSLSAETTLGFQFYRHAAGVEAVAAYKPSPITGRTYHIVGTYDGVNIRLYVDGVLRGGPTASAGNIAAIVQGVRTGFGVGAPNYPDGRLDELAVYLSALSPVRVLAHYQAGAASPRFGFSKLSKKRMLARP
jgi:hypothetical protein